MFAIPQRIFRQSWVFFAVLFFASTAMSEEPAMSRQQQCAEYGVYQDASENWVDCSEESSSSYSESEYREEVYVEDTYVEDTYVEETYTEETYVEPPYVEDRYVDDAYVEEL